MTAPIAAAFGLILIAMGGVAGLAIGVSIAGGAAVMSLAPLVLSAAIDRFDWRLSWSLAGLAVWSVVMPIAWWGLRDRPADVGQQVDGAPLDPDGDAGPVAGGATAGWTRREALRTLMFWAVTAAVATSGMITTGLAFHEILLLGERGLTVAQAAANFVPQTVAAIIATLAMGALVDRIAPRLLVPASMAAIAAALVLAQVATPGLLAIAFGPLALALGFDRYGTNRPVLSMLIVVPIAVAVLAVFARVPSAVLHRQIRDRLAGEAAAGGT